MEFQFNDWSQAHCADEPALPNQRVAPWRNRMRYGQSPPAEQQHLFQDMRKDPCPRRARFDTWAMLRRRECVSVVELCLPQRQSSVKTFSARSLFRGLRFFVLHGSFLDRALCGLHILLQSGNSFRNFLGMRLRLHLVPAPNHGAIWPD